MKFDKLVNKLLENVLVQEQSQGLEISNDVLFDFNAAVLTQQGKQILQNLANTISKYGPEYLQQGVTINITGHADLYGPAKINDPLSQNRANAVQGYLNQILQQAGAKVNITAKGLGSTQPRPEASNVQYPIKDNKAPEQGKVQQQPNRRVELTFNPPLPSQVTIAIKKTVPNLSIISTPNNVNRIIGPPTGNKITSEPKKTYKMVF